MSDSIPVKINCFHSGVFKYDEDGKLNYVDGFMDQFEVNGDEVFEEFLKIIVLKVSVGRMWYKLPYEDISEKKELLENGEKNKKRMASNGHYYGELDVFIEKPETSEDDEVDAELQNDEVDAELQNDEVDGDDEAEESEDEYQASDKSDDEEDLDRNFEEDLEMFRDENYEDEIVDDDEVYPDTEQSFDDEEEQAERMANKGELDGAKIARRIVLDKLQAECNEHFARLRDYEMELLRQLAREPDPEYLEDDIAETNISTDFSAISE
ncbi:hypothetical protein YC2023_059411 [Brassica napus]